MAEYIITVKKGVNWEELHSELKNDTSADSSVDSSIIPDREVPVIDEQPTNTRNTHYDLTKEEADALQNDDRILNIIDIKDLPKKRPFVIYSGNFEKDIYSSEGHRGNWGLLRHINKEDPYTNDDAPNYPSWSDYPYVLDGTGVDVVIMDTGIEANHPEWEDTNGTTRLKQVDWFSVSGLSGTMPSNHYTDSDGHGTHVAGTVAGKHFGWAKNADIYVMQIPLGQPNAASRSLTIANAFNCLKAWHQKKNDTSDPSYTGRPTVLNCSWGSSLTLDTGTTPNTINGVAITGGSYRGTSHSETERSNLTSKGFIGWQTGSTSWSLPMSDTSDDANIEQCVNAGIHISIAAGNDNQVADVYGGLEWDNYLTAGSYYYYYNRPGSPSGYERGTMIPTSTSTGQDSDPVASLNVGAMGRGRSPGGIQPNHKASFSQSGKGIDIYAAGDNVMSAYSTTNSGAPSSISVEDYVHNNSYKQVKSDGTSMASPQIAGMIACLLQAHPDWTPAQMKNYMANHSQPHMSNAGTSTDYTDYNTIHDGTNRVAYFPMSGSKPYNYGG